MKRKNKDNKKRIEKDEDILLVTEIDRRTLPNVPDKDGLIKGMDIGEKKELDKDKSRINDFILTNKAKIKYVTETDVKIKYKKSKEKNEFTVKSRNISANRILLQLEDREQLKVIDKADSLKLQFEILPGSMPEGYEMKVKIKGKKVSDSVDKDGKLLCEIEFSETLSEYSHRKKGRYYIGISSILLIFISLFIMLMRAESIIYFKFNKWAYLYSIIAVVFLLSRYLFGALYKPTKIDPSFTPGVTIIVPCFNEEQWIQRTIAGCMDQYYPMDKLEVIVVDDRSDDKSVEKIKEFIQELKKEKRFETDKRLKYIVQEKNMGKREALSAGVLEAKHDLIVFVDSDSFLDPYAILNLVQPFKDPKMGGVAGRTDVANTYTNVLTKMQSVRYYIAFRIMKAAEGYFDAVTCLSGPLSCYKKEIIMDNMEAWLNQSFLGQKATFGDDRAMTNFVLSKHRTAYQDTAVCSTIVPNKYKVFLKQQMRWKRSWLRESIITGKFVWKKEPFMALFFYIGLLVPMLAPMVVIYNLLYIPIFNQVIPTTFLVGLLMMALMMSAAQMLFRKSTTWIYGIVFCAFYEAVLLWQMPIAWVTFWKSTWGTRMTQNDIEAKNKKIIIKKEIQGGVKFEV